MGLSGAVVEIKEQDTQKVIHTITTDGSEQVIDKLIPNKKYVASEKTAPAGYEKAEDIVFSVNEEGKVTIHSGAEQNDSLVVMVDKKLEKEVTISKVEVGKSEELPGAELKVVVKDSNPEEVVAQWTSGETPKKIKVEPGKVYQLVETSAPEGYLVATSINFRVTKDGTVKVENSERLWVDAKDSTIKMEDVKSRGEVQFSKVEKGTNTEVSGTTLQILKEADESVVKEWTSGEITKIELEAGKYIYREKTAPDGYEIAKDIHFEVTKDGKVMVDGKEVANKVVVMEDEKKVVNVKFNKVDEQGLSLAGATIKVIEKDSEAKVKEITTDGNVIAIEGLTPEKVYVIKEITAPERYEKAADIEFSVKKVW